MGQFTMAQTRINSPLERRPIAIPGSLRSKTGPCARFTPAARVGPSYSIPAIGPSPGSNRAASFTRNAPDDTNSRVIDRAPLSQDQDELYGRT